MDDYKLNFSLCTYMCTCGYYKFSWNFIKKDVNQAIYNNHSSFTLAFPCRRCGKLIALEFLIRKVHDEYFIENRYLYSAYVKKRERKEKR